MFHWICPECGREIPPAVKECPVCDPQISDVSALDLAPVTALDSSGKSLREPVATLVLAAVSASVVEPPPPVQRAAESVSKPPLQYAEPDLVPDPVLRLALTVGAAVPVSEVAHILAPVLESVSTPISGPASEPDLVPDPVLRLVRRNGASILEQDPVPNPAVPVALRVRPPEAPLITSPPELPGLGELAAALDAAEEAEAPPPLPSLPLPSIEPEWKTRQLEAPAAALALLAAPAEPPPAPEPVAAASVPSAEFAPHAPVALATPAPIPLPIPVPGVSGKPEAETAFARPAPALALAALQDYSATAIRKIRPSPPRAMVPSLDGGPRTTLPGPALPPQLLSLRNAGIATVANQRQRAPKKPTPGWLVTALVTVVLLGIGVAGVFVLMPHVASGDATPAATVPPLKSPAVKEGGASTASPLTPFSLAKTVEVTGFRFSTDPGKKPEVHYIVVNHSNSGLDDVMVYVTLRTSGAKPGQPPFSKFSFHTPNLGPFESKEMTSPIEKLPRPGPVPEWQDLRADLALAQ